MLRAAALLPLAGGAAGHGYVLEPPSRVTARVPGDPTGVAGSCALGVCYWFNEPCTIPGKVTIPKEARTMRGLEGCGVQKNPWCAPGTVTENYKPCGTNSGSAKQNSNNGGTPADPWPAGFDGRDLPELKKKTYWKAGEVAEIQWSLIANHGGGYQYRLCPKSANVTEECFQQTPLEFAGDEQYIQYCSNAEQYPLYSGVQGYPMPGAFPACDPANRTAFKARKVSEGTFPPGSTWMVNPIPGCYPQQGYAGHKCGATDGTAPSDFQFPPVGPDLARPGWLLGGFGGGYCFTGAGAMTHQKDICLTREVTMWRTFQWNIVDKVNVPKVPPGEYIMSFRWDCEQTNQIWATCSDVTIQ